MLQAQMVFKLHDNSDKFQNISAKILNNSMHKKLKKLSYGVIIPFSVLIVWGIVSYSGYVKPFFIPTPTSVLGSILVEARGGNLWQHIGISCLRTTLGFLMAAFLAYPIGAAMGINRVFANLIEPFNDLIRYMPVPAFIPLLILWFGIGITTQIAVIFIGTFFQLTIMIQDAFASIPKEYIETGNITLLWISALMGK